MTAKLFKTLRDGNLDELEELIAKGAQVNEADKKGYSPLIECATQGFPEGIPVLLAAGAKSSAKDKKDGRTALIAATVGDQAECVAALLKDTHIADVINLQDYGGMTALHWALSLQLEEIATQLMSHSAIKFNIVAKDGYTPLMYAVQTDNEEAVKTLLKNPAAKSSLTATDKTGNTALHLAALLGHKAVLESLASALSTPSSTSSPSLLDTPNLNGENPLHLAAAENNVEVVRWLIAQGVDLKALTNDGATPYQVSEPDSASAQLIAEKTGETPSIITKEEEEEEEEIIPDELEEEEITECKHDEGEHKGARKRVRPPPGAMSAKKGKNKEEAGNPLIARLLLVLIVGSTLTYLLSMFF